MGALLVSTAVLSTLDAYAAEPTQAERTGAEPSQSEPPANNGQLVAPQPRGNRAFPYSTRAEPQWLRLALEQLVLLAAGSVYYYSEERVNSQDWYYGYEWSTLRDKLVGDAYAFDDNYFNTNYISHPGAGALYYSAARANHLGVGGSLLTAFVSSAVWEFLGEFRERVSINDVFVTPLAGFAFGESMIQVGGFFDRSCDSTAHRILASTFATAKAANDYFDGLTPLRSNNCDRYGLTRDGYHRFDLVLGGFAAQMLGAQHDDEGTFGLTGEARVELENLREVSSPGVGWTTFDDGNISSLQLAASMGGDQLHSASLSAKAIPFGVHSRELQGVSSRHLWGSEWLAGIGATADYKLERFASEPRKDTMFVLGAPASWWTWRRYFGSQRLALGGILSGALGGVTSLAATDYEARNGTEGLTRVVQNRGYNHVAGVATKLFARWVARTWEVELEADSHRLFGLLSPDAVGGGAGAAKVTEARRSLKLELQVGSARSPRWVTALSVQQRQSSIGDVERGLAEGAVRTGVLLRY